MFDSRVGRLTIFVGVLILAAVVALIGTLMWRAGWFDEPSSGERYVREQNRILRRQIFGWVANAVLIAAGLVVLYGLYQGAVFMSAKVARAGDIRAKGRLLPVVRRKRKIWVHYPGEPHPRRVAVETWLDLNKTATPITTMSDNDDPQFIGAGEVGHAQLSATLGAQTIARQAAAAADGPITVVDDDPATADIVPVPDRAPLPDMQFIPDGHVTRLLEESEGD